MSRMVPSIISDDVKSNAERRIFKLFSESQNTENWVVLHSLGLSKHIEKRRGEIDFLVVCPRGVFVLEVKGGGVKRSEGRWTTTNKYGDTNTLNESPYDQSSSAMFSLQRDLKKEFGNRIGKLLFGYGVLFPDVENKNLGSDGDPAITYTIESRRFPITKYIGSVATFSEKQTQYKFHLPEKEHIEQIVDYLRGDFDLVVPLWTSITDTSKKLLELTKEQYELFDLLKVKPRVTVSGSAGTGKTLIAVQDAIQAAQRGLKTIIICYNKNLAAHLKTLVNTASLNNISVFRIYELMKYIIESSSIANEFNIKSKGLSQEEIYGDLFPKYAKLAATENGFVPWDIMVVDEGQDFAVNEILDFLDRCIDGGFEAGNWRWFMDDNNQAGVFGMLEEDAVERLQYFSQGHTLTINCRNTIQIQCETILLTEPLYQAKARIAGSPVKYLWYSSDDEKLELLRNHLNMLIGSSISAENIIVLSPKAINNCTASKIKGAQLAPMSDQVVVSLNNDKFVRYATISSYKGLENEVVIITDIEDMDSEWSKAVLYVGMSRAKSELMIMLPINLKKTYMEKLSKQMLAISNDCD